MNINHLPAEQREPYQLAMMLCGGGHQYARLLGSYQGVVDSGKRPELLVATCGGAVVANLICRIESPEQRLAWLGSRAMHRFWASQQAGPGNRLGRMFSSAITRKLAKRASVKVPDLFNTWLFDFTEPFPALPEITHSAPDMLIMGSQLHYRPEQLAEAVGERKLFSEAVFSNARVTSLLEGQHSVMAKLSPRISKKLVLLDNVCSLQAARISVADCYYYAPIEQQGAFYSGGLINLFPAEIALRCAKQVIAIKKQPFDRWLAAPAIRHVFAFDANQRLQKYQAIAKINWLPDETADSKKLASIYKQLDWRTRELSLRVDSYDTFKQQVLAQYQAGYQAAVTGQSGK